ASSPRKSPLFPYTTLFRSRQYAAEVDAEALAGGADAGSKKLGEIQGEPAVKRSGNRPGQEYDRKVMGVPRCREGEEGGNDDQGRSEEHTSELQSPDHLVCR